MAEETIELADTCGLTFEQIGKAKLQIDSRKWLASKIAPKLYGEKTGDTNIQVNVTQQVWQFGDKKVEF